MSEHHSRLPLLTLAQWAYDGSENVLLMISMAAQAGPICQTGPGRRDFSQTAPKLRGSTTTSAAASLTRKMICFFIKFSRKSLSFPKWTRFLHCEGQREAELKKELIHILQDKKSLLQLHNAEYEIYVQHPLLNLSRRGCYTAEFETFCCYLLILIPPTTKSTKRATKSWVFSSCFCHSAPFH